MPMSVKQNVAWHPNRLLLFLFQIPGMFSAKEFFHFLVFQEKEAPYITVHGTFDQQFEAAALEAEQKMMPDEPKRVTGYKTFDRLKGNIGNMLHSHRTVEDSMKELIRRQRWD